MSNDFGTKTRHIKAVIRSNKKTHLMDGRLIKSGAHQRFIRMLIDKTNDDKKSMTLKPLTNKNGTYKNSIE